MHALVDEVGDAVGQHPGLARAGTGDHQQRAAAVHDGVELVGVQAREVEGARVGRGRRARSGWRGAEEASCRRSSYGTGVQRNRRTHEAACRHCEGDVVMTRRSAECHSKQQSHKRLVELGWCRSVRVCDRAQRVLLDMGVYERVSAGMTRSLLICGCDSIRPAVAVRYRAQAQSGGSGLAPATCLNLAHEGSHPVESLTGNTWKAAERDRLACSSRRAGSITGLNRMREPDHAAIQDADFVLVGTWIARAVRRRSGAVRPRARIGKLPMMRGKKAAVFCTFALHPAKTLDKLTQRRAGPRARRARRGRR